MGTLLALGLTAPQSCGAPGAEPGAASRPSRSAASCSHGFLDLQATGDGAAVKERAEEVSKSQLDVRNVLCWRDASTGGGAAAG